MVEFNVANLETSSVKDDENHTSQPQEEERENDTTGGAENARNGDINHDRAKKQLFFFIKTNNTNELKKVL